MQRREAPADKVNPPPFPLRLRGFAPLRWFLLLQLSGLPG